MHSETIRVGDQTINFYESNGTGPAALLVHGNSSSGQSFLRQLQSPLGQTHRLVAIDLAGHGSSAPGSNPQAAYTLPGQAQALVTLARQLGLESAVLVGWSLGGHVVLEASDLLPDAAGLMIFGTPPLGFPPAMGEAFLPHPAMGAAFKAELSEEETQALVSAFFMPNGQPLPDQFIADARRTDGQARAGIAASIQPGGYRDEVEVVTNLRVPLAVLHGLHDGLVNLDYLNRLTMPTLWRGAVQVIADAGHAPHWEQPAEFNALLQAFIEDTSS